MAQNPTALSVSSCDTGRRRVEFSWTTVIHTSALLDSKAINVGLSLGHITFYCNTASCISSLPRYGTRRRVLFSTCWVCHCFTITHSFSRRGASALVLGKSFFGSVASGNCVFGQSGRCRVGCRQSGPSCLGASGAPPCAVRRPMMAPAGSRCRRASHSRRLTIRCDSCLS